MTARTDTSTDPTRLAHRGFVLVHDADFKLIGVSEEVEATLGYTSAELAGMSAWEPGLVVADEERASRMRSLLEGDGEVTEVATVLTRDGRTLRIPYTTRRVDGFYVTVGNPKASQQYLSSLFGGALSRAEAADEYGVSVTTIDRWRKRGLPSYTVKPPRRVIIYRHDLYAFVGRYEPRPR